MSIKNKAVIQFVTINGVTLSTLTGVVTEGSKAESALKAINAECKKSEIIRQARVVASTLTKELGTPGNTPNIDYLCACMVKSNKRPIFNWLLTMAKTIDGSEPFTSEDIYHLSAHLLMILKEILDGHC